MKIVLNSKFFAELEPAQLGEKVLALGYEGIDLCVRPGHPVHPGNVEAALPPAVEIWRRQGLSCPLVSAPVTFNDPALPEAVAMYRACAQAGVPAVKIGYWMYEAGTDYGQRLAQAQQQLGGFAELSRQYGVRTCCHTHSGPCLGSNCAGVAQLVQPFDPALVGVYPDFGHMALDGEDLAMGLAMVADRLAVVGIKDGFHAPQQEGGQPGYVPMLTHVGGGSVDWRRALGLLRQMGYQGALAVHTEYQFAEDIIRQVGYADKKPGELEKLAVQDAVYLRRVLAELELDT
ncbi:MAG: TIM barrel protein [Candidatus Latescibacteria bacterium]|nr:TIM barrel protein [Candidatus Latescibacterota bacterium]